MPWGKVTGKAKFAEDYNAAINSGAKCCARNILMQRLLRIDTSIAEQLPGVEAVLTAKDIPGAKEFGVVVKKSGNSAVDRVRYLGDGVVIVAAQTKEIAEQALTCIKVEYEQLPVVSDPEEALKSDRTHYP